MGNTRFYSMIPDGVQVSEEEARALETKSQETWHWKEVDLRDWASNRLKELFKGRQILDSESVQAEIWKTEMYGEAFATSRKGSTEVTCNLDCRIYWRGKYYFNGAAVGSVCGTIKFPEVVASTASEEWPMLILADGEDPSAMRMLNPTASMEQTQLRTLEPSELAIREAVVKNCADQIRALMSKFVQDMKCFAAKEPIADPELVSDKADEQGKVSAEGYVSPEIKRDVEAKMEALRVEAIPPKFAEACALMEANEGPERVELSVCRISDVEIPLLVAALKKNTSVTFLNLAFNHISDVGVQALATAFATGAAKNLKELTLHNNKFGEIGKNIMKGIGIMRKGLKLNMESSLDI